MKSACFIMIVFIFFAACTTSPVTPSRNSRQTIDSIFQHQTVFLQHEADSLCLLHRQMFFQAAVDSIMYARQSEMNNLVR